MAETTESIIQGRQPDPASRWSIARRAIVLLAAVAVGFMACFVPMKTKLAHYANNLSVAQQELGILRIQANLTASIIDARRGECQELARRSASRFFTALRADVDQDELFLYLRIEEGKQRCGCSNHEMISSPCWRAMNRVQPNGFRNFFIRIDS